MDLNSVTVLPTSRLVTTGDTTYHRVVHTGQGVTTRLTGGCALR